ncbi:S9 family peptidase [Cupriavidus sp. IK-TO18]|uniref:alpha/beta hydrolase family protein n=1 Tax=Cupriavidus sp. IK-TO18 TaxID=2782182 RepID=UPI001897D503|nr:CocE/NonD family hydrolase [Cupriavidus sp. IK-TO18]MBF6992510.1 prolyl oligopeptidase family serine peptidase [Cupriavidus sp. IK-TO18]
MTANASSPLAPAQYLPEGWVQWPDHPELSFQFARVLCAAQEGASTISECFLAASRMTPGNLEDWYAEWQKMGAASFERAEKALKSGYIETAKANLLRGANYYRSSEFYLGHDDPRRLETFGRTGALSRQYLELMSPAGEVLSIDVGDGTSLDAYFIKPAEQGVWPTVICFGGLDEYKDELLHEIPKYAFPRGMALLLVDLPGQGGTLRLRKTASRPDTEVPVGKCVDYLLSRKDVDGDRIALYGASVGGIYAARAASVECRLKAVVSDSLIYDIHEYTKGMLAKPDALIWGHLKWVFGQPDMESVVERTKAFRMADFIGNIKAPYLIVQGEQDWLGLQTAVDAYEDAKANGVDVQFKVFTAEETGASHCQIDNATLGQEYICDWIADKLGLTKAA